MGFATYRDLAEKTHAMNPKPRTPADIGRDIAELDQCIRDLKAELATLPPSVLVLNNVIASGSITFENTGDDRMLTSTVGAGFKTKTHRFNAGAIASLRAWLNHYYPEA